MNFLRRIAPAMRGRNFQIYFWSQLASYIGTGLQAVTLSALVYEITGHSSYWASMVIFLGFAPSAFLCPTLGGFIGDRYPVRMIMYVTQTSGALLALLYAYFATHNPQLWQMIVCTLTSALIASVDSIGRHKLMMEIVPSEHVPSAQALNGVLITTGSVIGGSLVGVSFVLSGGYAGAFVANAGSFVAVLATLHMMTLRQVQTHTEPAFRMLRLGAEYILSEKSLLAQLVLSGIFSAIGFSYRGILPAMAREIYNVHTKQNIASVAGYISATIAFGSVVGGFMISAHSEKLAKVLRRFVLSGSLVIGVSWIVIPVIHSSLLGMPLICLFGVGVICSILALRSNVKQTVKMNRPDMLGRVIGFDFMFFHGGMATGNLGIGVIADRLGLSTSMQLIGVLTVLLTIFLCVIWKRIQPPHSV